MNLVQFDQQNSSPLATLERQKQLVIALKSMYPSQFRTQLEEMDAQTFETIITGVLMTVSDEEFQKGFARLMTNPPKFMPSVVEFKNWCTASNWLSANEAWHHACEYSKSDKHKITVLAKECWDAVYHLVLNGDMREAKNQFISTYEDRLSRAIQKGATQAIYKAPVALPPPILERAVTPRKLDSVSEQKIKSQMEVLISRGMDAGQAAMAILKGEVA